MSSPLKSLESLEKSPSLNITADLSSLSFFFDSNSDGLQPTSDGLLIAMAST